MPDCQLRPKDNLDFLEAIGNYIVKKQPDKIINLGDFADMCSLSSYDQGKKSFEGRRYVEDIAVAIEGNQRLWEPLEKYNAQQRRNGKKQYKPETFILYGNHEHRINRAVNDDAKLDGVLSVNDLLYTNYYNKVNNFLDVVILDGIAYSHYFVTGVAGRPASTASAQLRKTNMSSIAGHQQGRQVAYGSRADGSRICSIIAGSAYEHDEDYLGPQGNKHWRGIIMLHEVIDGSFDEMFVSTKYLKENYL